LSPEQCLRVAVDALALFLDRSYISYQRPHCGSGCSHHGCMPQLTRRREPGAHTTRQAPMAWATDKQLQKQRFVAAAIRAGGAITHAAHLFGRPNRRQLTLDAPERMFLSRGEKTAVPHRHSRRLTLRHWRTALAALGRCWNHNAHACGRSLALDAFPCCCGVCFPIGL